MGWRLAALVALLFTGPATAGWTQLGGGPERAGTSGLSEPLLDVHAVHSLLGHDDRWTLDQSPVLAATPHGFAAVVWSATDGACRAVLVSDLVLGTRRDVPLRGCRQGLLVGYDETHDALLVCSRGPAGAPILQSFDATSGEERWSIAPAHDLEVPATGVEEWSCGGGAIAPGSGQLAIPFIGRDTAGSPARPVIHRLVMLLLETGEIQWQRSVPDSSFLLILPGLEGAEGNLIQGADPTRAGAFAPLAATHYPGGVVFAGEYACPERVPGAGPCESAFIWYTTGGEPHYALAPHPITPPDRFPRPISGSAWATGEELLTAVVVADLLVVVRGGEPAPERFRRIPYEVDLASEHLRMAAPVWAEGRLLVPTFQRLLAFRADDLEPQWDWDGATLGSSIEALLQDEAGGAWVLQATGHTPPRGLQLVRLDMESGRLTQLLPLPLRSEGVPGEGQAEAPPVHRARLVPWSEDRLLVVNRAGDLVLLGPGRGSGHLCPFEQIPSVPGDEVSLRIDGRFAPAPRAAIVHWGDGSFDERPQPDLAFSHRYTEAGLRAIILTCIHEDGTTASQELLVEVGGSPPVVLGAPTAPAPLLSAPLVALLTAVGAGGGASLLVWAVRRRQAERSRPPRAGRTFLGRYDVERRIGAGSFGRTWLATRRADRRRVALKELHPVLAQDDHARARFEREARVLSALDHPRVTRLLGMEACGESRYLVMEFVEGGSLEDRLAEGPLDVGEAAHVAAQMLEGLAFVHARGVLHRDVKPSNVLLSAEGEAKLADFGLATHVGSRRTQGLTLEGLPMGTPLYMAPEQARGDAVDARSDLYAVAATFVRLVTGDADRGRLDPARVPHAGLRAWAAKGLALRPDERHASAAEMLAALREFGPASTTPPRPAGVRTATPRASAGRAWPAPGRTL